MLTITIDARSIVPVADAYAQAGVVAPIAIARALNWTGNKARTQVARTLARDTGVGYGVIRNALRTTPASPAKLTYEIGVSGAHIPLAEFHARQTRRGVSAAPWGQRRVFPHTFIVEQLGGQVFKREGRARLPIRKLWGPSLPIELVRGASPAAFEKSAAADLPQRLAHELGRLFPAPGMRAGS
jgi:Prophage minor tail protein Z (GPZ)